ncbi:MAG TPA: uroporphyrinogen-III synthase [Sphingomicrobium sp.]|nr:uroporphyrinogen-III synthase [Sphingomicrobium sp.]
MRKLFILRPEPAASASAERALALGLTPVVTPLFAIHPVKWIAPDPAKFDGLLLTSANAVRHGGESLDAMRSLPVHAVGEATAEAARAAGFKVKSVGSGNIDDLLAGLPAKLRLMHLCGFHRRPPASPRQTIITACVYRSRPAAPPPAFRALPDNVGAVHSAEAARRLAELILPVDRKRIRLAAISQQAAIAAGFGWQAVAIAPEPSDEALLVLAAGLCDKPFP